MKSASIFDSEIVKEFLVIVLCCQTGICKVPGNCFPFVQSTIIEHFQFVCNNERNNVVIKTFLEHYQASDSAITILKGVYCFKTLMKAKYIIKQNYLFPSVFFYITVR